MTEDSQRWKEKYLHSLEEQERLDKQWQTRVELLRRGLVRSSLAAEGLDKAVDQCMGELREAVRADDMAAALSALLPRLEKTLLGAEQRRQDRVRQVNDALAALVGQLMKLDLPDDVRKPLRKLEKGLVARLEQPAELAQVLAELSYLQSQSLNALDLPSAVKPGLLERLFGSREAVSDSAAASAVAAASGHSVEPQPQPQPQPVVSQDLSEASQTLQAMAEVLAIGQTVNAEEDSFALPADVDPGYAAIADHVEPTLLGLIDSLELPDTHKQQAQALRARIAAGLNLYELVTVLDDLAVLLRALSSSDAHEFRGYLQQLNERLALFQEGLRSTHEGHAEASSQARELDDALRNQVGGLQTWVREANDLSELKTCVDGRLDGLLNSLAQLREQRELRESEVAQRLQELSGRVSTMEQEAQVFQQHLEQERQKALVDSLTGLPNRAAWNERSELEMARVSRYGGELLLAVIDIDFFKRINDNYGHLAGDKVLKLIAGELAKRLRKTDFMARLGGEEFVVLLPATPLDGGAQLMESLRQAVESCPFHFRGEPVTITVSIGLTAYAQGESIEQIFERADQALYKAKGDGRNRIQLG